MNQPPVPAGEFVSRDRLLTLTADLVRCDTQNPPGTEASVVPTLVEHLRQIGCEVQLFHSDTGRPSVLARYRSGTGELPVLLFNGHLDVVPAVAADWTSPPFEATLDDDRLVGRGTADMKGGIAAVIEGLRACQDSGAVLGVEIVLHLVADEETGGEHGSAALLRAGLIHADACVVPEPTEMLIGVAERGSFQARVEVFGVSGHGGDPTLGRSAIADAARLIEVLHAAQFPESAHPLLGSPSCNVSMVSGGLATNVIAPNCEFTIDRRTLPGQSELEVLRSIHELIGTLNSDIDYTIEPLFFCEASELSMPHPFADFMQEQLSEETAEAVPVTGLYLGTDARFMRNQLGIPTIVCGPGSMRQAHTVDEWVEVEQLLTAARLFARVMSKFRHL